MRSLSIKLILAFLVVSLVGTLLVAAVVAFTTTNRFGEFVAEQYNTQVSTRLVEYYRLQGSWAGVVESVHISPPFWQTQGGIRPPSPRDPLGPFALADQDGHVVVAGLGLRTAQTAPEERLAGGIPLLVDGKQVGTLVVQRQPSEPLLPSNPFLRSFYSALGIGAVGATGVALLLGVLLARSITRPVRELTDATRGMAQGDLAQQIPIRSRDEMGRLAASFNQMSAQLARGEELRRQMTADIAHELRAPLSLILGHAEALSDGVLPPSPETFAIIHDEARRLASLVEDLRTLSLFDAGEPDLQREPTDPGATLQSLTAAYQPRALARQITLTIDAELDVPWMDVDPDRIMQVLRNLLDNALRYTPTGGHITLSARGEPGERDAPQQVRLSVQDDGPGIAPEDIVRVFERFYRGDKSRQRPGRGDDAASGSGLGLAIARSIVEGHGGRIWAESVLGAGTTFHIMLPAA